MKFHFPFKRVIVGILALIACICVAPTARAYGLEVELMPKGRLTLQAENVPLRQVLHHLARQGVGVRIDPDISLNVSAAYRDADVGTVLSAILGDFNHALIWDRCATCPEEEYRLSEIQIFKSGEKERLQPLTGIGPFDIVQDPATGALYVRNEVLVRPVSETGLAALKALAGRIGAVIADDNGSGIHRVVLPDDLPVSAFIAMLRTEQIAEAEPNFAHRLPRPHAGVAPGITPPALNTAAFGKTPPVAVFDSGLSPEFSRAPYVLDTFNAVNPDAPVYDLQGHGTQMAMIAAGAVAPLGRDAPAGDTVPVISIQGFDENGFTSNHTLMRGIDYAMENGARVLSLSWHATTESPFLNQYLERAAENGLVIVAAAGNEPTGSPVYPAAGTGVIGVGALAPDGARWSESNFGDFVAFEAPGFANLPTGYNGPAGIYAGTSIATAYTARLVSGYLARHPEAGNDDVSDYLRELQKFETPD